MSRRTERLNDLLREEISDLLQRDLRDPRITGLVSITEVDISPDLRHAKVFVSVLGSLEEKQSTLRALTAASRFLQRELRPRIKARHTPELTFVADDSLEHGANILALLREQVEDEPS